jgi:glycogen operon protein
MLTTLLVSQGVPMLLAGDEFRRSQQGNNNAYCQDNEISWIDWTLVQKNEALLRFVRTLIHFRRNQPVFRRIDFLTGETDHHSGLPDVGWFSPTGTAVNWSADESALVCLLSSRQQERRANASTRDVVLLFNGDQVEREFITPSICRTRSWSLFADTDAESPADIFPDQNGPLLHASGRRTMAAKSVAIYLSR